MTTPHVKATYSLDVRTVRVLEAIAKRWGVSKSEALRRAINSAASLRHDEGDERLATLRDLQTAAGLSASAAKSWSASVRAERRANSSGHPNAT
jgi:hypothetical protein